MEGRGGGQGHTTSAPPPPPSRPTPWRPCIREAVGWGGGRGGGGWRGASHLGALQGEWGCGLFVVFARLFSCFFLLAARISCTCLRSFLFLWRGGELFFVLHRGSSCFWLLYARALVALLASPAGTALPALSTSVPLSLSVSVSCAAEWFHPETPRTRKDERRHAYRRAEALLSARDPFLHHSEFFPTCD